MSDDKAQQEPSMEDILASIRRILSEDEAEEQTKAAPAPEPEPPAPAPEPEPEGPVAFSMPDIADEPEPAPVSEPVMAESEDEDVLELTDDMVLDQAEEADSKPAFDMDDFGAEFDDAPAVRVAPPSSPSPSFDDDDESLLSPHAADRSASALSALAQAVARERAVALGNGGITLEELVREILKPILKDWLDQNLPYMIERIVKKEIEKMVNRAETY